MVSQVGQNPLAFEPRFCIYEYLTFFSGARSSTNVDDLTNMNANGAGVYSYVVPEGTEVRVAHMTLAVVANNPKLDEFGNIPALATGVRILVLDSAKNGFKILLELDGGRPIKQNSDFMYYGDGDMVIETTPGSGMVKVRDRFSNLGGSLKLKEGQSIRCVILDDLSGLDEFRGFIGGVMTQKEPFVR